MNKKNVTSKVKTFSRIENCRAVGIGIDGFAECLQKGPNQCSYSMPFGYCFLCQHPRLGEILENTKAAQRAATVSK